MICENCKSQIPDDATVCSFCNTPVRREAQKLCPYCSAVVNEHDEFCMSCGNKLGAEKPVVDRPRVMYDDKEYTRIKKGNSIAVVIVIVLAIVAICLGAYIILQKGEDKNVNNHKTSTSHTTIPVKEPIKENVLMLSVDDYDTEVNESSYILTGKATVTTADAVVSINDKEIKKVTVGGGATTWSAELSLKDGTNVFDVKLADNQGHVEAHTVKITKKIPQIVSETPSQSTSSYKKSDGYLFPSDSRYITESDLYGLSKDEVALIRNEIYARHGYKFKTKKYQDYFGSKSWYYINPNFSEAQFNSIEKANKDFIVRYEKERGWR